MANLGYSWSCVKLFCFNLKSFKSSFESINILISHCASNQKILQKTARTALKEFEGRTFDIPGVIQLTPCSHALGHTADVVCWNPLLSGSSWHLGLSFSLSCILESIIEFFFNAKTFNYLIRSSLRVFNWLL